jgi:excisionase family DNA binding protein
MVDPVSIPEAAHALQLSLSRVHAMVVADQLPAKKIGGRWLIERSDVERRRRLRAPRGRPFGARNAWALLLLASGEDPAGLNPSDRSRLRRALALEGLEEVGPRLGHRAKSRYFDTHPGEILYVTDDPRLLASGVSAAGAYGLDLVPGAEADGYVCVDDLESFVADHVLRPADLGANLRLRVVPEPAWSLLSNSEVAPLAAVALDLAEEADPRSAQAGRQALRELRAG